MRAQPRHKRTGHSKRAHLATAGVLGLALLASPVAAAVPAMAASDGDSLDGVVLTNDDNATLGLPAEVELNGASTSPHLGGSGRTGGYYGFYVPVTNNDTGFDPAIHFIKGDQEIENTPAMPGHAEVQVLWSVEDSGPILAGDYQVCLRSNPSDCTAPARYKVRVKDSGPRAGVPAPSTTEDACGGYAPASERACSAEESVLLTMAHYQEEPFTVTVSPLANDTNAAGGTLWVPGVELSQRHQNNPGWQIRQDGNDLKVTIDPAAIDADGNGKGQSVSLRYYASTEGGVAPGYLTLNIDQRGAGGSSGGDEEPDCKPGEVYDGVAHVCTEAGGTNPTMCADSVRVERWIPGTGKVTIRGKDYAAGHKILTNKRFSTKPGQPGQFCEDRYDADRAFAGALAQSAAEDALSTLLLGGVGGERTVDPKAAGLPLGDYGYRAIARFVACEVNAADGTIASCDKPEVAQESEAKVTVACDGIRWVDGDNGFGGWTKVEESLLTYDGCAEKPKDTPKDKPREKAKPKAPRIDAGAPEATADLGSVKAAKADAEAKVSGWIAFLVAGVSALGGGAGGFSLAHLMLRRRR